MRKSKWALARWFSTRLEGASIGSLRRKTQWLRLTKCLKNRKRRGLTTFGVLPDSLSGPKDFCPKQLMKWKTTMMLTSACRLTSRCSWTQMLRKQSTRQTSLYLSGMFLILNPLLKRYGASWLLFWLGLLFLLRPWLWCSRLLRKKWYTWSISATFVGQLRSAWSSSEWPKWRSSVWTSHHSM